MRQSSLLKFAADRGAFGAEKSLGLTATQPHRRRDIPNAYEGVVRMTGDEAEAGGEALVAFRRIHIRAGASRHAAGPETHRRHAGRLCFAAEISLQRLGGAATCPLVVNLDACERWRAEKAKTFIVVCPDNHCFIGDANSGALTGAKGKPCQDIVAGKESERARKRCKPVREGFILRRGPPCFVRLVDAHITAGGADTFAKTPVALFPPIPFRARWNKRVAFKPL